MSESEAFINQVTLDCLLNKELFGNKIKSQKIKSINKEERKFYKKRIYNLFKNIITGNDPNDLLPDVKYAYENFVNASIHYLKTIDNNDLIQAEYGNTDSTKIDTNVDIPFDVDFSKNNEADKLMMRSIKIDLHTLDKYVTKKSTTKKETIILPQQKNINLLDPELKSKGLKKENINNKYEDDSKKEI